MKKIPRILAYFSTAIKAMYNPSTLHRYSLESIKNAFDRESVKIISRIYPHFFDGELAPEYSGLYKLIYSMEISNREIDLSNLNLKTIPSKLARKMKNVEKLDLSDNEKLNLDEKWVGHFFENLKELSLNDCNLTDKNLKAISKMKSLERLNLSGNKKFNIEILEPLLTNLKHLDISYSCFDFSDLEYILNRANKLESLDFSGNNLFNYPHLLSTLSKNFNLKILKLSNCFLGFKDIQNIIQIKNLEEVDFSKNYLSDLNQRISSFSFEHEGEKLEFTNTINLGVNDSIENISINLNPQNKIISNLKKISMSDCFLKNEEFLKILFDIEGLEVLNLEACILNSNMKEIFQGSARNTLKEINVSFCGIEAPETIKELTNFKKLEKLDISGNLLNNLPHDFSFGQSKYTLKELAISTSDLNMNGFRSITECTSLEKLDLSWTNLSNIMPMDLNFEILKNSLKELDLSGCEVNHIWFKILTDFPKLERLDLFGNNFSLLTEEYSLGRSKESLKEIDLRNSKINYRILSDITDCSRLQTLDISYNNFEEMPSNFKFGRSKESLKELYANNSNLNSNGLQAISECKRIEKLSIHENNFFDLPDNFSFGELEMSLKNLRIFDSNINYSCLLAISKCKKLVSLNIENNNLDLDDTRVRHIIEKLDKFVKKLIY